MRYQCWTAYLTTYTQLEANIKLAQETRKSNTNWKVDWLEEVFRRIEPRMAWHHTKASQISPPWVEVASSSNVTCWHVMFCFLFSSYIMHIYIYIPRNSTCTKMFAGYGHKRFYPYFGLNSAFRRDCVVSGVSWILHLWWISLEFLCSKMTPLRRRWWLSARPPHPLLIELCTWRFNIFSYSFKMTRVICRPNCSSSLPNWLVSTVVCLLVENTQLEISFEGLGSFSNFTTPGVKCLKATVLVWTRFGLYVSLGMKGKEPGGATLWKAPLNVP